MPRAYEDLGLLFYVANNFSSNRNLLFVPFLWDMQYDH